MRILSTALWILLSLTLLGCNEAGSNLNAQVRENAEPVADSEVAVIEMENQAAYGSITVELYSNIAPKMVERFKQLAKEGVYDGVIFHRVNQSVIQSGDPLSKDDDPGNDGTGKSDKPDVQAEFSDIEFDTGIVGAARGPDFDSQNSQFFITLKREPGFDRRYTIFGKVIDGMVNARTIGGAPRDGEKLIDEVRIKTIRIEPRPNSD
ncbi:MAG: peptidylprolyl isomerase [Acidobacteria bacterium]|mgnify:CR=1 FL=1|nr:MAG: peptidylprolyl isomerase [Acidobacteriota bacterium]REK01253.1 MAG: peptidylprolyl isomerase [Acidobacteriota bacterium]REK14209.1 MAG: peptidylprolyl isomerase [Acidobacteriota bacterium]REK44924.1 MAG: peptidylprolyl isomerase [Acidobacteriota bacterium]